MEWKRERTMNDESEYQNIENLNGKKCNRKNNFLSEI